MKLKQPLENILSEYKPVKISGDDWHDMKIEFNPPLIGKVEIRNLKKDDYENFLKFRNSLSERSKELFCPYPWDDEKKFKEEIAKTIEKSESKIDANFLMFFNNNPIGNFFLWKAGGNPHSQKYEVDIPELGIGVADEYQGKKLGKILIKILQEIAKYLNKDAIELTTAITNDAGWYLYIKTGFEYTGDIENPLEVDVTEATKKPDEGKKYRKERQMAYIINPAKRQKVLDYLEYKKRKFDEFSL